MEGSPPDPPISVVTDDQGDIVVCFGPRCVKVSCGGPPPPSAPDSPGPDDVGYKPDTGQIPMRLAYRLRNDLQQVDRYIEDSPNEAPVSLEVPYHTTVNLDDLDDILGRAQDVGRSIELRIVPDG